MREIKFKAWMDNRIWEWEELLDNKLWIFNNASGLWIFLQFTGLKDKNGKGIYEGDIVEYAYEGEDDDFEKYEIAYEYGAFFLKGNSSSEFEYNPFSKDAGSDMEVIGNIYENPELLK